MSLLTRISNVFWSRVLDEECEDELRFHLDQRAAEYVRQGMAEDEAKIAARLRLGDIEHVKVGMREARIMSKFVAGLVAGLLLAGVPTLFLISRQEPTPSTLGFFFPGEDGVTMPVVVKERKPHYTPAAIQDKASGMAQMICVVQPDGVCSHIRLIQPVGHRDLDDEAVAALRDWRFRPATRSGTPVPALVTVEVRYTLK